MEDRLVNGRKFRTFNVLDDYNREALSIEVDYSFPSEKVVKLMQQIIEWPVKPENIRSDNGTEFTAKAFEGFCLHSGIKHLRHRKANRCKTGMLNALTELIGRMYWICVSFIIFIRQRS